MADKYKMGSIYPIEPNPILDAASHGTEALRKFLNREYKKDAPKGELGDLLLGRSPEELNKWAYGFHPFNDVKDWARTGPLQEQRQSDVADVVMLPVSEALSATGLAAKGLKSLARGAIEGGTSLGRRQFLKNAGAATAGAAVATPLLLRSLGKDAEKGAAKAAEKDLAKTAGKAATHATPEEFYKAMHEAHEDAWLNAAEAHHEDMGGFSHEAADQRNELIDRFREKYGDDTFRDRWRELADKLGGRTKISQHNLNHMNLLEDRLHVIRQDPHFAPYKDYIYPQGHTGLVHDMFVDPDHPMGPPLDFKRGGAIERTTHDRKIL